MGRQKRGQEAWKRLLDWHDGQTSAERLASRLLNLIGYSNVDLSHPLGGPDGKKDIICKKDGKKWVVGVYFPNGQKKFKKIEEKFENDLKGVDQNDADGFVFVTNQELKISEKKDLKQKEKFDIELIHLEALASLMDAPLGYALRMEFLDIEMNKEEQLSYMVAMHKKLNTKEEKISDLKKENEKLKKILDSSDPREGKQPTEPYHTTAKELDSRYDFINRSGSISMNTKFVHNCSNCGYGFYVSKPNINPLDDIGNVGTMGSMFAKNHAVECPKCGNVDSV